MSDTEANYIGAVLPTASAPKPKGKLSKAGERFRLLNNFVDFTVRQLGRHEVTVWLVLYRDSRDGIARTGLADIAERIGKSTRTAGRSLKCLKGLGLVVIVKRGRLGQGPTAYRLRGLIPGDA